MKVEAQCIYLGAEEKDIFNVDGDKFTKTGDKYNIIRVLDNEGGIIEVKDRENKAIKLFKEVQQLDKIDVTYSVTCGKYINIDILQVKKL